MKTSSMWSSLFFMPLIFIGAFFLLNLTLAVINSKFNDEHNRAKFHHSGGKKGRGESNKELDEQRKEHNKISAQNRWDLLKRFLLTRRVARKWKQLVVRRRLERELILQQQESEGEEGYTASNRSSLQLLPESVEPRSKRPLFVPSLNDKFHQLL
jgi:hypothetical protein